MLFLHWLTDLGLSVDKAEVNEILAAMTVDSVPLISTNPEDGLSRTCIHVKY